MTIQPDDRVTARLRDRAVQPDRHGPAGVVDESDARVATGVVAHDLGASIGAGAIDTEHFDVVALSQVHEDRIQAARDVRLLVAHRHDDRHERHFAPRSRSFETIDRNFPRSVRSISSGLLT